MRERTDNSSVTATLTDEDQQLVIRANYELFVFILSIIQVLNSCLIIVLRSEQMELIPAIVSAGISLFLLADAFYRLKKSYNRRRFLFKFHGYLLFLGSLPIPFIALARLLWYRLVTQRFRHSDYQDMERVVIQKRAESTMLGVILAAIIVLQFSSLLIIKAEAPSDQANITTANDAIWWSFVTMATVGYGDRYPVTAPGRMVGFFVMIVGVGLFTVLTSFLAHSFLRSNAQTADQRHSLADLKQPSDPQNNLTSIRQLLDQQEASQQAALAELRTRLDELEHELATAKSAQNEVSNPQKSA